MHIAIRTVTLGVASLGLLLGCSTEPDINPIVKSRIDALERDGNCSELQSQFDIADNNSNVDIMKYVDSALRSAGCY